jgi:hypothetical protein
MALQLHGFPLFEDSGKRFRVEKNEALRKKWDIVAAPFPGSETKTILCYCFDRDSADAICEAMNVSADVDEAVEQAIEEPDAGLESSEEYGEEF